MSFPATTTRTWVDIIFQRLEAAKYFKFQAGQSESSRLVVRDGFLKERGPCCSDLGSPTRKNRSVVYEQLGTMVRKNISSRRENDGSELRSNIIHLFQRS